MRGRAPSSVRCCVTALIALCFLLALLPGYANSDTIAKIGESIYQRGVLASGALLKAIRSPGVWNSGAGAACINCHQRSGLGSQEGPRIVPPIAGSYLFDAPGRKGPGKSEFFVRGMHSERAPYTEVTLARALREGVGIDGRPLDELMPHFEVSDGDVAALTAYLKDLTPRDAPGVTETELRFATIITPDADPVKTKGMLDVLQQYVTDKNAFPIGATPRLRSSVKIKFMANRHWQLNVWRLSGPPSQWSSQLAKFLAEAPVFAVVSGIGGKTWEPIARFCEQNSLPCLFPNIETPPDDADRNFYSMYFSKGVLLEAELIANALLHTEDGKRMRLVHQIYRAGDNGEVGGVALAAALRKRGIVVHSDVLPPGAFGEGVATKLRLSAKNDALVLWLRPADLTKLGKLPKSPKTVYISGLLGGLEHAPLPSSWRESTLISYPFDLPQRRRVRVDFARGWFAIRHIPVVDERLQTDTYLVCGLLAETLSHMSDTFVRDYLIENFYQTLEHRIITGYYPHLSLATGQRFASKGGFFVHFTKENGSEIVSDSAWIRP